MRISLEQVRYVAEVARLELAATEEERLTDQLNAILEYMGQLAEVDTAGVEPTSHVLPLTNVLHDLPTATAHWLADADHGFRVPRRTGRTDEQVRAEVVAATAGWLRANTD